MNRFYPGKPDGTQTERVSYAITKQVVERCDYLVDFHGGDIDESLRPYAYWPKSGNAKQDAITRDMVLAFGLDTSSSGAIVRKIPRPRAIWRTPPTRAASPLSPWKPDTPDRADGRRGAAGQRHAEPDALSKNAAGSADEVEHPVWIGKVDTVASDQTGIFYPLVQRGTYVKRE